MSWLVQHASHHILITHWFLNLAIHSKKTSNYNWNCIRPFLCNDSPHFLAISHREFLHFLILHQILLCALPGAYINLLYYVNYLLTNAEHDGMHALPCEDCCLHFVHLFSFSRCHFKIKSPPINYSVWFCLFTSHVAWTYSLSNHWQLRTNLNLLTLETLQKQVCIVYYHTCSWPSLPTSFADSTFINPKSASQWLYCASEPSTLQYRVYTMLLYFWFLLVVSCFDSVATNHLAHPIVRNDRSQDLILIGQKIHFRQYVMIF